VRDPDLFDMNVAKDCREHRGMPGVTEYDVRRVMETRPQDRTPRERRIAAAYEMATGRWVDGLNGVID